MTDRVKFLAALALQCLVLIALMGSWQWTLATGRRIVLQTVPVDPRDLFRGDYVVLRYHISTLERSLPGDTATLRQDETVYVVLQPAGRFYQAVSAHRQMPPARPDQVVIRGRVVPFWGPQARVAYGIESYYVPEGTGHELERLRNQPGGLEVEVAVDRKGRARIREVRPVVSSPATFGRPAAAACQSNLKLLALAMIMYTQDYHDSFPPAERWADVIQPYVRNSQRLVCPAAPQEAGGYAFNRSLGGKSRTEIVRPANTPMLFESTLTTRNAADEGQSWPVLARHEDGNNVAFVDGHVDAVRERPAFAP